MKTVLLENGQQILGPREKKEDGSQTPRGKKKNRRTKRKEKFGQLNK